jgi:tetratricopeptide (TPR) repeat protein
MGEKIVFPLNYEGYLKKGLFAFEEGNLQLAEEWIGKAIAIKQADDILPLYLMLLQETDQAEKSLEMIKEIRPDIAAAVSVDDIDFLYLKGLLQSGAFDMAREQIDARKKTFGLSMEHQFALEQLEADVEKVELKKLETKLKKSSEILRAEKNIDTQPFHKQQVYAQQLKELEDDQFGKLAQRLLLNNKLHRMLKTEIIHQFLERGLRPSLTVRLDGSEEKLDLARVVPLIETKTYKEGMAYIQEEIANKNPALAGAVENGFFMQLSLLYPFEDRTISSVPEWLDVLCRIYSGTAGTGEPGELAIRDQIERLEKRLTELFGFFE